MHAVLFALAQQPAVNIWPPYVAGQDHAYPSARWPSWSVTATLTVTEDPDIRLSLGPPPP